MQVSLRYNDVPYHNFWHCVDVAHSTFLSLLKTRRRTSVTQLEMLGLLTAAVCHDLEHPGTAVEQQRALPANSLAKQSQLKTKPCLQA